MKALTTATGAHGRNSTRRVFIGISLAIACLILSATVAGCREPAGQASNDGKSQAARKTSSNDYGYCRIKWEERHPDREPMQELAQGNTQFACEFYQQMRQTASGNLIFSPYSISAGFGMLYAAAGGPTKRQIADVMHFTLPEPELHEAFADQEYLWERGSYLSRRAEMENNSVQLVDSLWVDSKFKINPEFNELIAKYYNTQVLQADLISNQAESVRRINAWTQTQSMGMVDQAIAPATLAGLTGMILVNVLTVVKPWDANSELGDTAQADFHLLDGTIVQADMMHREIMDNAAVGEGFKVLRRRFYRRSDLSITFLLPDALDGISMIEDLFSPELLTEINDKIGTSLVTISLPKFVNEQQFDTAAGLQALGMTDAFVPEQADFSGLFNAQTIPDWSCLGLVFQNSYIKVCVVGVEAAAATTCHVLVGCVSPEVPEKMEFNADHPFMFYIQDDYTGAVLFIGRVLDPRVGGS